MLDPELTPKSSQKPIFSDLRGVTFVTHLLDLRNEVRKSDVFVLSSELSVITKANSDWTVDFVAFSPEGNESIICHIPNCLIAPVKGVMGDSKMESLGNHWHNRQGLFAWMMWEVFAKREDLQVAWSRGELSWVMHKLAEKLEKLRREVDAAERPEQVSSSAVDLSVLSFLLQELYVRSFKNLKEKHVRMTVGLDYDMTITLDPELWREWVELLRAKGHVLVIVTGRVAQPPFCDPVEEFARSFNPPVPIVFAGLMWKKQAALAQGFKVDVWIDDLPEYVGPQDVVLAAQKMS